MKIKIISREQIEADPSLLTIVNSDEWKQFDLLSIAGMQFELMVEYPDAYYGNLDDGCLMSGNFVMVPKILCKEVV